MRQQQPGGIADSVLDDLTARGIWSVLGVADDAQGRAIQQCPIIKMQNEHRRVRRNGIEFLDRRQTLFGKLTFGKTSYDPHPLRWRGHRNLTFEHTHGVSQRTYAVPAQFHVVVEPATDDVSVAVDQAWDRATSLQVNDFAAAPGEGHNLSLLPYRDEASIFNRYGICLGITSVERRELTVAENEIGLRPLSSRDIHRPGSNRKTCCRHALQKPPPRLFHDSSPCVSRRLIAVIFVSAGQRHQVPRCIARKPCFWRWSGNRQYFPDFPRRRLGKACSRLCHTSE